jgi:hypothetical protein
MGSSSNGGPRAEPQVLQHQGPRRLHLLGRISWRGDDGPMRPGRRRFGSCRRRKNAAAASLVQLASRTRRAWRLATAQGGQLGADLGLILPTAQGLLLPLVLLRSTHMEEFASKPLQD